MADLVTRILLDDKQFNDNIQKSKKQVKDFEGQTAMLKSGMLQFAGAMGVAVSAGALFQKTIAGSQTLSDGFNNAIEASKTTVDEFFSAMATGDFTVFTAGLDGIYKKALKAQEALDQLWNTQLSFDVTTFKTRNAMQQARETALDREATPEVRQQAMSDWKAKADEIAGYTDNLQAQILETVQAQVATSNALNSVDITLPDLFSVFAIDISSKEAREAAKEKAASDFEAYQKEYNTALNKGAKVHSVYVPGAGGSTNVTYSEKGKAAAAEVAKNYKDAILINTLLEKRIDGQLDDIGKKMMQHEQLSINVSQEFEKINKAKHRVENQIGAGGGSGTPDIIPEQSIRAIDKQIRDANDQLLLATTSEARRTWDATIKELEAKKLIIEVQYKYNDPGKIGNVSTDATVTGPQLPEINSSLSNSFDKPISAFENYLSIMAEAKNGNLEFTTSAYAMSDALSAMAGATEGSASEWLRWGANTLGAIATAIPAITALTVAQGASATAAAADAGAKGASAVAGIPIVGPILAVAAVASIVAALASIPKFEHGGIVGGGSFSGDNILARVNSGEMILNKGQQGNLFKMLNEGAVKSGSSGRVKFEIEGKKLVGILREESKRQSRV